MRTRSNIGCGYVLTDKVFILTSCGVNMKNVLAAAASLRQVYVDSTILSDINGSEVKIATDDEDEVPAF